MINKKRVTIVMNERDERVLKIAFPYDEEMLKMVRDIPGRKYHPESRCWSAPLNPRNIEILSEAGFILETKVMDFFQENKAHMKQLSYYGVPGLKGILYPFQNKGVAFIEEHKGRALIADEMGLGKTIQALAWLQLHREKQPVIIVVPASLKLNWEREAKVWLPNPKTEILSGSIPWIPTGDILIINYDILSYWIDVLKKMEYFL
jgi:SWI/SNF-related matrix-associated actin-dependent regulator 1 of chromatin subfamily A